MAGLYEEEILGAKQQAETARKLRELAFAQGVPEGRMVGRFYVGPHWTQHLGNLLRQYNLGNQEQEATQKVSDLARERSRATADLYGQMGIAPPESVIKSASTPAVSPGLIDRLRGFVSGEEAKGTPEQRYQPKIDPNATPEAREAALMQMQSINPSIGEPLLTYHGTKQRREEAAQERQTAREERQAAREENMAFKRDMWNAVHGGQPGETGINMGPRIKVGGGGGDGDVVSTGAGGALGGSPENLGNRKDIKVTIVDGKKVLLNVRTGAMKVLGAAQQGGAGSTEPKYDSSSDQWVYPPSAEHPAGMVTPAPGKIGALENFNVMADKLTPTIKELETGGVGGYKKFTAPIFQKDLSDTFDNRVEQLSGEARKIMRIPGEGTLSDKEQAQYGLQLPNKKFSPEVNEQIVKDLKQRMQTSVAPSGVSVPVPQVPTSVTPAPASNGWSIKEK